MLNCADLKAQLFSECLRKVGYRDVDGIDESYLISLVSSSPFAEHFITWITQKCSERNYVDDYTLKELVSYSSLFYIYYISVNHV